MIVYYLLVFGVLGICVFHATTRWLHRRGWITWQPPRGTSSALGNAVMGVQSIFQPPVRDVLEARLHDTREDDDSGDPPER